MRYVLSQTKDSKKFRPISTFIVLIIAPPMIFFGSIALMIISWALVPDRTGGCNPPGPDGPNCHLCPKGTTGCGDVYMNEE